MLAMVTSLGFGSYSNDFPAQIFGNLLFFYFQKFERVRAFNTRFPCGCVLLGLTLVQPHFWFPADYAGFFSLVLVWRCHVASIFFPLRKHRLCSDRSLHTLSAIYHLNVLNSHD